MVTRDSAPILHQEKLFRISWDVDSVFPRIIAVGDYFFFRTKKGTIIRLFQILLTGSHALNICFIFPLNQKIITSNKLNMGFLSVPNLVPWLVFRAWIVTDQLCWISLHFNLTTWQGGKKRKRRWREGRGRGDYSREAIILRISAKGGRLFEGDD